MFRIAICDDENVIIEELRQMVTEILKDSPNEDSRIEVFQNGEGVLDSAENIDIVFMDIEMPGCDGLQLGKRIKEINPKCKVIMATGMVERMKEAFYIHAHRFVTKPFVKEEIEEALLTAIEECKEGSYIEVQHQRNTYSIPQQDIQYLEAFSGEVEFEVNGGQRFRKKVSLVELEDVLDDALFARPERKYIVNLLYVKSYANDRFMIEDREFSISRRNKKEFERKYIEFDLKHRRKYK